MSLPAAMYGDYGDTALFMQTQFADDAMDLAGHFFLLPDMPSLALLSQRMRG